MSMTREVRGRGMDVREPEMLASLAVLGARVELEIRSRRKAAAPRAGFPAAILEEQ